MAFNLQVHKTDKESGEILSASPYVLLMGRDGSIYIRAGKFWYDSGEEVPEDEVPEWVNEQVAKLGNACRAEVGLPLKEEIATRTVSRGRTRSQPAATE